MTNQQKNSKNNHLVVTLREGEGVLISDNVLMIYEEARSSKRAKLMFINPKDNFVRIKRIKFLQKKESQAWIFDKSNQPKKPSEIHPDQPGLCKHLEMNSKNPE